MKWTGKIIMHSLKISECYRKMLRTTETRWQNGLLELVLSLIRMSGFSGLRINVGAKIEFLLLESDDYVMVLIESSHNIMQNS